MMRFAERVNNFPDTTKQFLKIKSYKLFSGYRKICILCLNDQAEAWLNRNDNCVFYYSFLMEILDKRPFKTTYRLICAFWYWFCYEIERKMWNTYGMIELNPITSTYCGKMTGAGVHHVEHSKKSRDPSFEHLRIYDGKPIKKHIPNTLIGVCQFESDANAICICLYMYVA